MMKRIVSHFVSLVLILLLLQNGGTSPGASTMVWPSLQNSVDKPPAARNAMDDECDGSALNSPNNIWTWTNQGASTETQANGWCSIANSTSNGSSHVARFIGQTLPSAPYTFTAKIAVHDPTAATQGFGGLFLQESSSGKYVMIGWNCTNSSCASNVASATANRYGPSQFQSPPSSSVGCVQVNRTNTTLTYSYSSTCITYITLYSSSLTADFTTAPDTVGVGVDPYSAGMTTDVEYFRRTL